MELTRYKKWHLYNWKTTCRLAGFGAKSQSEKELGKGRNQTLSILGW
jgi:hypothetical protein